MGRSFDRIPFFLNVVFTINATVAGNLQSLPVTIAQIKVKTGL
jgi:hypothetical protein